MPCIFAYLVLSIYFIILYDVLVLVHVDNKDEYISTYVADLI